MREKLKKLKESLDKWMLQKTKKQMIWYIIISYIIFGTGYLLICLKLDGNSIIVCLLGLIYVILFTIAEVYLGRHLTSAIWRDDERKKRELFKNGIRLNVVPVTFDAYKEIGHIMQVIMAKKQKSSFHFTFSDSNDYRTFVDDLIKDNELAITAELIDEQICISIYYEGEDYHPKELKSNNFRWFESNFSIVK